jgi:hypothetical protein
MAPIRDRNSRAQSDVNAPFQLAALQPIMADLTMVVL